jgi:hypothetical protein
MFCRFLVGRRGGDVVTASRFISGVHLSNIESVPYICVHEFVNRCEYVLMAFYIIESSWSIFLHPDLG